MFASLALFTFLVSARDPIFVEKIEARVGSQIITSSDVDFLETSLKTRANEPKDAKTIRSKAIEVLIEQALVGEFLKKREMQIPESEIDRRISAIRSAQGMQSLDEFQKLLQAQGLSLARFRNEIRSQMEAQQFIQALRRENLQTIQESELRAFFQNNKARFQNNYEIEIQECLLPFGENIQTAQKLALQYQEQPSKFSECVKLHSRSPSAARNGDLGAITRGILRPDVEEKLFQMRAGQVAAFPMPAAIQLLKVKSRKDLGPVSFDQAREEVQSALEQERLSQAKDRMLAELRASTFIRVEL